MSRLEFHLQVERRIVDDPECNIAGVVAGTFIGIAALFSAILILGLVGFAAGVK